MKFNRKIFSLLLVLVILFSSIPTFAKNGFKGIDTDDVKWLELPKIGEVKNKKFEVNGKLQIPKEFKGQRIVKLKVNGFNVVPAKDGSFSKSIFINEEVEVKVFTGKKEIVELRRIIKYVVDKTSVDEVIKLIDELPIAEKLTLSDKNRVQEVRKKYNALSHEEKRLVTNLYKLQIAERRIGDLDSEEEELNKPYVESVIHDINNNGNFYRLNNWRNLPEGGNYYRLKFMFKDGTEYLTEGNPKRIKAFHYYNLKDAKEIENFDVIIYEADGKSGPFTKILAIEDVPFAGVNYERIAIFAAETAVGNAEKAKNAGEVESAKIYLENAKPLVNNLPKGLDKDILLVRIQRVQDWIDDQLD